jgi:N-acetyl-gamma-glutamyl-phosphate reductase
MKTAVLGASGYAGGELLRLLDNHPAFVPTHVTANSHAGERISSVHPQLNRFADRAFESLDYTELAECELVFMALPHGESAKVVPHLHPDQLIVDLGADFRIENPHSWEKYYGGSHAGTWTYGLPELKGSRNLIMKSKRVANPGCYATAIALAAAPILSIVDSSDIVVVAASGTTGAGRSAKISLLGSEVMGSLTSYKFGGIHQHTPEIEESLGRISGSDVRISFTPILAPMPRGILATLTGKLNELQTLSFVRLLFSQAYDDEQFVTVLPEGHLPKTSSVLGSNHAQLQVAIDEHVNRVVVSIAIDNLGKGAAAQALQNANLIAGLPEETGLLVAGLGA